LLKDAPKLLINTDQADADDEAVQLEVRMWLRQQPKDFYAAGIGTLIKRWDKCINVNVDYVGK
jgi:head-tail adaptor